MSTIRDTKKAMKKSERSQKGKEKKKCIESSDSSDNSEDDSEDEEEEEDMDVHEYRKFLNKIFPSKHLNNKIKSGEKVRKIVNEESESESESESEYVEKRKNKNKKYYNSKNAKNAKKMKSSKKVVEEEDSDEDDEDDEEEEEEEEDVKGKNGKINMVFTIGVGDEEYDDYDSEEDEEEEWETEDEDVSVSSASDSESGSESESDSEPLKRRRNVCEQKEKEKKRGKDDKEKEKDKKEKKETEKRDAGVTEKEKEEEGQNSAEVLSQLKELYEKSPSETMKECIKVCEDKIEKMKKKVTRKDQKMKDKHSRIFRRIIKDKNEMNDNTFFKSLKLEEQRKIIKELREINKNIRIEKPYRITLLESDIPTIFKGEAIKKINSLKNMEPCSGEYYKIKNWVDTFMRIPFGTYRTLPITMSDGVDKCHEFMENAQRTLDNAVYGLNDAKMQIMQMVGQLIANPQSIGTSIAIHGPMGTGKTSIVKEGISKILDRPFAFIALGGATDSSFLEGHSYTYEGSIWGKIVQIIIDSKCMNPVIYFDELDKISDTPKGEEIAGILTHLTDTSQNSQFHDKYFAELEFDLSKCLFIFSYNDESKVNPILRDRMYRIQTKGYEKKQKTVITNQYLLPKIQEQVKFDQGDIIIPEDVIHHIIDTHCNKEDGVRNLKRCLEIIHTKLNLYRLMKPDTNLFEEDMSLKVEFPFTVTKDIVEKLIKKEKDINPSLMSMYC